MPNAMNVWLVPVATALIFASGVFLGDMVLSLTRLRPRTLLLRLAAGGGVGLVVLLAVTTLFLSAGWSSTFGVAIALAVAAASGQRRVPEAGAVRPWRTTVLAAALGAAAYSLWLAWWLTDGSAELVRAPFQRDSAHYVVLTAFLDRVGVETPLPHFLDGIAMARSPYHYVDAWLGVAVARTFPVGHALAYLAVAQSLQATLLVLAAAALIRRSARTGVWVSLSCALFALLPGVDPVARLVSNLSRGHAIEKLSGELDSYVMSPLMVNKMLPAALLLVFALLAFAHRRSRAAAPWILAALPIAYVTFAPFAGAALGAYLVRSLMKRSWLAARRTGLALGACVLFVALGFAGVSPGESPFLHRGDAVGPALSEVVGGAIRVVGGATVRLILLLVVPTVAISLVLAKSARLRWLRQLWWLSVPGLLASVLAWGVVHRSLNSWQLLTTPSACVFALLYSVFLALMLGRLRLVGDGRPLVLRVGVCLGLSAVAAGWTWLQFRGLAHQVDGQMSPQFRASARRLVGEKPESRGVGVWIRNGSNLRDVWDYALSAGTHPIAFLLSDVPYTIAIPLGRLALSDGVTGERERVLLRSAPFFQATKLAPSDEVTEQQVESFLGRQRVSYALLDPGVSLSGPLGRHLDGCEVDSVNGTRLCLWRSAPVE